jgi:hypothetical protein
VQRRGAARQLLDRAAELEDRGGGLLVGAGQALDLAVDGADGAVDVGLKRRRLLDRDVLGLRLLLERRVGRVELGGRPISCSRSPPAAVAPATDARGRQPRPAARIAKARGAALRPARADLGSAASISASWPRSARKETPAWAISRVPIASAIPAATALAVLA